MTIRVRLILIYLFIFAILLSFFSFLIYFQSENHRQKESSNRLEDEANVAATIFFKKNEISPEILKLLDRNNFTALVEEEIIIFDTRDNLVYESGENKLDFTQTNIKRIKENKKYFWAEKQREFYGIQVSDKNKQQYVVIASAIDKYGLRKQQNLALMLAFLGFLMLLLSAFAGWLFVKRMLRPINQMIYKIDSIKSSELALRLEEGNRKDEFAQLSIRFNRMLERLQKSFLTQRAFVSNASHELRTPLTSITGQIQVSLLANDKPDELKQMIKSVLDDVQQLNILSNNLLDLTSIELENQDHTLVNILDKTARVRMDVIGKIPNSVVLIQFDYDDDIIPEMFGNAQLLYTAFLNLIENGIKYSTDHTIRIKVSINSTLINLEFQNKSKTLTETELQTIFNPFVRGKNAKAIKGHGVGLSLTKRIIEFHNGTISLTSTEKDGFLVLVSLPR